jgi:hypothetical protein
MAAVRFFLLLALGLWIGEIAFFSFIGAPAIFAVLDRARAGDVTAAIFPRYYALGVAAATMALGCALVLGARAAHAASWRGATVAIALGLAATLWAARVVQPRAAALRVALQEAAPEDPARAEFARLHRIAVALNAAALVAGVVGLGCSAAALRP